MDTIWLKDILSNWGVDEFYVKWLNLGVLIFIALILLVVVDFIIKKFVVPSILRLSQKSNTQFDDHLVANKTFVYVSRLIIFIIAKNLISIILVDFKSSIQFWLIVSDILILICWYLILKSFLRTIKDHLSQKEGFRDKPLGSYVQVADIVLVFIVAIVLFTLLTGKNPWAFLTAMGAASAIAMLVFKDTILGFVASIQVSVNDMVRIGDWIEMPKYNADGDVIEINLNTVKVQNWDKTITTIPTHYLVTDSFKNWRGMQESGGRRIKRAINIKISSIRFLQNDEIEKLKKIQLLAPYIAERHKEIEEHNQKTGADREMLVNGRNMTNIGLFREYVSRYIRHNPNIRQDMTLLVRQLSPTENGLPLELYMFTADTRWAVYENILSDIFDHLFAAIKYFDLEVFESPASDDIRQAIQTFTK